MDLLLEHTASYYPLQSALSYLSSQNRNWVWSIAPDSINVMELCYLFKLCCDWKIAGVDEFARELRNKIGGRNSGSLGEFDKTIEAGIFQSIPVRISNIKDDIFSKVSELYIAATLSRWGYHVFFRGGKGSDLILLHGNSEIGVEVSRKKSWHVFDFTSDENMKKIFVADEEPDARQFEGKARDEMRQGRLVVIDISSTLDGFKQLSRTMLFPGSGKDSRKVVSAALEIVKLGESVAVFFARRGNHESWWFSRLIN